MVAQRITVNRIACDGHGLCTVDLLQYVATCPR